MKRLILAALLLCGCTEDGGLDLDSKERVEYLGTGTTPRVLITLVNQSGNIEQHETTLPYRYSGTFDVGAFVSISVTNFEHDGPNRSVHCEILQDGGAIEQSNGSGGFGVSADCSGSVH